MAGTDLTSASPELAAYQQPAEPAWLLIVTRRLAAST
jgi:hypothetical protein